MVTRLKRVLPQVPMKLVINSLSNTDSRQWPSAWPLPPVFSTGTFPPM